MMRVLVFTTLYPNAAMPAHGVFVENRLRAFLDRHDADVRVVAPVPWFPFRNAAFGRYGRWAQTPLQESRRGIDVYHPRYFIPPKAGMTAAPYALARCLKRIVQRFQAEGWDFDLIDAHYLYPDSVAAARIAHETGKPVVITARGSDVTLLPRFAGPRNAIVETSLRADAIIAVAKGLKAELLKLGASEKKVTVLRNGVDLEMFRPVDRDLARRAMNLDGPVIASIGHLIDRKGHDIIIDALSMLPDATLLVVGAGEQRTRLKRRARTAGIAGRVRFLGAVAHDSLRDIYNAADVLALASSREGWPNVLLEALACGTRCAASQAGGAEVIQKPEAGVLVEERTPKAFADAIGRLLNHPIDRIQTRHYAEAFSWAETADGVASVFSDLKHKTDATSSLRVAPIVQMSEFAPKLIVTVDTEEQFNWAQFDNIEHTVCAPSDIARFQSLCAEFAIQPLYFLSYPLLTDDKTVAYFRTLLDAGDAFGGLHLHQWATPPERGFAGEYYSFQKNLPPAVHAEKLAMLANAFEAAIGFPAIAHRAGRYGISPADYVLLAKSGVSLDFSPSAAFDFSPRGGPDFSGFSNQPFRAYGDDWSVCVTPVSGAHALKKTRRFRTTAIRDIGFAPPDTSPARKVLQPMRLSPEGADLQDLQALTQRLIADRTPVLTFTLHSTSLTPGANPYARAEADVDRLLQTCRDYFTWFRNNIRGDIIALPALADIYEQATQASA